jgi:hypothetical protein
LDHLIKLVQIESLNCTLNFGNSHLILKMKGTGGGSKIGAAGTGNARKAGEGNMLTMDLI